jgi:hypothetical protein
LTTKASSYLENFDTRIVGLTGSDEQIAAVAKLYRVYYSPGQNEQSGVDLVSHSTFLYLMNPSGQMAALFPQDVTADKLTAALRVRLPAPKRSAQSEMQLGAHAMMGNMGGMIWGMGLLWLIVIAVLLLAVAALIKYLFFNE